MSDLKLERDFNATADRLFEAVTRHTDLMGWWGPEDIDIIENDLDLSRIGPWFSVMRGRTSGQIFKVSGQVTHVSPPTSVGFTWGWHDDMDARGTESHVTFTIAETPAGSRLTIDHRDLSDDEMAAHHEQGWASSMQCLLLWVTNPS